VCVAAVPSILPAAGTAAHDPDPRESVRGTLAIRLANQFLTSLAGFTNAHRTPQLGRRNHADAADCLLKKLRGDLHQADLLIDMIRLLAVAGFLLLYPKVNGPLL
jgi:hypothetical protein